jgi:TolB-like protein/DNA-binding SARP family transcriptional activator
LQRLKLFGGICIERNETPLAGRAVQRRRLALLAMLAVARAKGGATGVGVSRDKLIAMLWPTADAENGRRYLSDSVYRINQALDAEVIAAAGDELHLDTAHLPTDLVDFQECLSRDDHAGAVAFYVGPFLDGFHLSDAPELEHWIDAERAHCAAGYARALEILGAEAARKGDASQAVNWIRRLAAHDPYNSRVALLLMRTLRDAGDAAAAIQHARVHETLLRQELELEPDPAVTAFVSELRSETGAKRAAGSSRRDEAGAPPRLAEPLTDAPYAAPRSIVADSPDASRKRRISISLAAAGVVVLILAALFASGRDAATRGDSASTSRTIAVLPFANVSPEADNDYFSDGMTEELIATLGAVEGVDVASRTSAFAYKNRSIDIREIGKQLGVDAIVEGSVRKSGRTLRISVQLVSAKDGLRLWSEVFDREVDDVFAIQEEIARAVVARVTGSRVDSARTQRPAIDPEAYDLYLRGRFAWHQRTRVGLNNAIAFFSRAVARAPAYARAQAGLADAYAVSAFYDYRAPREAYPRAEAAAKQALTLDPELAAAHATLGYIMTYYHLDWPAAEAEFKRALAIDPAYSTAHQWYANLLTVAGRFDEAEREMRLAQETDPLSLIANAALGWSFFYGERYEAALDQCRETLALNPDYELAHLWGGWALTELGRTKEAREWIGRAVSLSKGSDLTRLALALVLARSPETRDSALAIASELASRAAKGEYVPSYEVGKLYSALGDRATALRWLERAIEERSHSRAFLRVDPQLAPFRGDERFERLVARAFGRQWPTR